MIEWLSRLITYIQTGSVGISHDIPSLVDRTVGTLLLPSRILSLGDIQSPRALELPAFAADQATVSVKTLEYPSGAVKVVKLTLVASSLVTVESRREVGGLGIDSAKMIVADKGDMDLHWTDVGKDRIGIISAASAGAAFKVLKKQFKFRTRPLSRGRAELIDPVSETLEAEIEAYLKSIPRFADYPFMYFFVQTNDSFERANSLDAPWGMIPVGNEEEPMMLVCDTGHGDGGYAVMGGFSGNKLSEVSITFIDDAESKLA